MKKIRRIIVSLEPAPRNWAVLEAAARLAGRMEAELVGLFVENINLLHFAGLPFACETGFASATKRDLDVEGMERSLRALAREAHQSLAAVAGRVPVRWSFRVTRGLVAAELLAEAAESDLVIANIEQQDGLDQAVPVRIVRAGDSDALRAALEAGDGILVLAGADDTIVGDTLRDLLGQEWP
jgi:K+-sensing histidine kinase KdpD